MDGARPDGEAALGVEGVAKRRAPEPCGRIARRVAPPGRDRRRASLGEGLLGLVEIALARGQSRDELRPGRGDGLAGIRHQ